MYRTPWFLYVKVVGINFSHLNSPDLNTGMSPIQVAIKTGNFRTVQTLLNAKASLEHVDNQANSVFHYAANTTKEIILVNIMSYNVPCMGKKRNAYRVLVAKPEGKRCLGRPMHRWVNSIQMHLKEVGWDRAGNGGRQGQTSCN
jgi:hypothetical protein